MPLHVTSWHKFQTTAIANITRSRTRQNEKLVRQGLQPLPLGRPYTMEKLLIARQFDRNFAVFAKIVGTRQAETFWVRTLQFVADGQGLSGMIHVPRIQFGAVVLSRRSPYRDVVSAKLGGKVWDALIAAGLAAEVEDTLSVPLSEKLSDSSRYPSPSPSPSPSSQRETVSELPGSSASDGGRGSGCPEGQPRPASYFMPGVVRGATDAAADLTDEELLALQDANRRRAVGDHPNHADA